MQSSRDRVLTDAKTRGSATRDPAEGELVRRYTLSGGVGTAAPAGSRPLER